MTNASIAIEFGHSQSPRFASVLQAAQQRPTFESVCEGKIQRYRVTFHDMADVVAFVDNMNWIRNKAIWIDGREIPWHDIFKFRWCYRRRVAFRRPDLYCHGLRGSYHGDPNSFNMYGCIHSRMSFTEFDRWYRWGEFVNGDGDWRFDKSKIHESLDDNVFEYRFCPALDIQKAHRIVEAIPEIINPLRDRNWMFVPSNDLTVKGLLFENLEPFADYLGETIRNSPEAMVTRVHVIGIRPRNSDAVREIYERADPMAANMAADIPNGIGDRYCMSCHRKPCDGNPNGCFCAECRALIRGGVAEGR